jgi:hypothetical protein
VRGPKHVVKTGKTPVLEGPEWRSCSSRKNGPLTGGGGRSHQGKMLVVGALKIEDGDAGPGRIRARRGSRLIGRQPASLKTSQWGDRQDRRMVR